MSESGFDRDVVVVGAGAAGLFAATEAALAGRDVLLIEKMKKAGVKILASGGSRCNVTSTLPIAELGRFFGKKGERFLRYALHEFGPLDLRALLAEEDVPTDEFPMEKVFPRSGRAADVLRAFLRRLDRSGARLATADGLRALIPLEGGGFELRTDCTSLRARKVIVTAGGCSYPKAGTTGDGYRWLAKLGLEIVPTRPALVPLVIEKGWLRALTGIAVEDAVVEALDERGRSVFSRRRPVLFTHRGLSGPGAMDISSRLVPGRDGKKRLRIDWLPEVEESELEARLLEGAARRRPLVTLLPKEFPRRLHAAFLEACRIPADRASSELRREERQDLITAIKRMVLEVDGDEGFAKAEVTAGGLALSEVDPTTMQLKRVPGLYVAGEILDLDGPIGGFNFQAAFSTGTIAGRAAGARGLEGASLRLPPGTTE